MMNFKMPYETTMKIFEMKGVTQSLEEIYHSIVVDKELSIGSSRLFIPTEINIPIFCP